MGNKNQGVPPTQIPMTIPLIGGSGKQQNVNIKDAIQGLMQRIGQMGVHIEQLAEANNTLAMEVEMIKKRVDALEARPTFPKEININVRKDERTKDDTAKEYKPGEIRVEGV